MTWEPPTWQRSGMPAELTPPHVDLTFMSPLSSARADGLARFLAGMGAGTVLDIGCGWGELLLRTVAASPGLVGVGVDSDARAVAHGRSMARERGLADRLDLRTGRVPEALPDSADAVICIGASQAFGPPVEANRPLDYAAALHGVRRLLTPGGRAVFGEGIWSREPTAAAVAPLAGRLDEFVRLGELVEIAVSAGFAPFSVTEATQDEWDEFESGYTAPHARWLAEHPADHPDAEEVRRLAARQRAAYLDGYRGTLGLAYLCLLAV